MKCRLFGFCMLTAITQVRDDDEIWFLGLRAVSSPEDVQWTKNIHWAYMVNGTLNAARYAESIGLEVDNSPHPAEVNKINRKMSDAMRDTENILLGILANKAPDTESRRILEL